MDLIKSEGVKKEQATCRGDGQLAPINGLVSDEEQMKEIAER